VHNAPLAGAFSFEMSWYRYDAKSTRLTLTLHIQPGAKKTEIVGEHGGALKIKIAAAPLDGAANEALLKFLARTFGVPRQRVQLKAGASNRRKVIDILNPVIPVDQVWTGLDE
jgi:uncharacterized protein